MHRSDVISLCSVVVGVASLATDAVFGTALNSLLPAHAVTIILGVLGVAGLVAAQVKRSLDVPANTLQQAVAQAQTQAAATASVTAKQVVAAQQNNAQS